MVKMVEFSAVWEKPGSPELKELGIQDDPGTEIDVVCIDLCGVARFNPSTEPACTVVLVEGGIITIDIPYLEFKRIYEQEMGIKIISHAGETIDA